MTDAEKFVRERWPKAEIAGPMRNGRHHSEGGYLVYASPNTSSPEPDGSGATAIAAWADAANRIEAAERGEQ